MNKRRIVSAVLLCAVGIGIAGLQCGLTSRYYTVVTDKIEYGKAVRLTMLSDLHSYIYGNDQTPLLRMVEQTEPDLLLLCGDIVDDIRPMAGAKLLLGQLSKIAPCYYVSGNHEFWSDNPSAIFSMIEGYGIHVLRNEKEDLSLKGCQLTICGVDDPSGDGIGVRREYGSCEHYLKQLSRFDGLPRDRFNILLAHRPEFIKAYAEHPIDLTLCGHAHGGQWRIPGLLNGLVAPNQGFFPKYAGGRYTCGEMTQIIGRGLVRDWKPRFFNPPEIVSVEIKGNG